MHNEKTNTDVRIFLYLCLFLSIYVIICMCRKILNALGGDICANIDKIGIE